MNVTQDLPNKIATMFDAELYNQHHDMQRRDVKNCLNKYSQEINWFREGARIFDIGSGDGSTTANILTKYIPANYKELIGGDVSENMVQFSNKHYAGDRVSFVKLDIEEDLPEEMEGNFDHVFSFYTFHWVLKQRKAYKNVHKMLNKGGSCMILFVGHVPFFDMFRIMSKDNRWSAYDKNPKKTPYSDSKDPENKLKELMEEVGFKNVIVKKQPSKFIYKDWNDILDFIKAINAHRIPDDQLGQFENDCEMILKSLPSVQVHHDTGAIEVDYFTMFALGNK